MEDWRNRKVHVFLVSYLHDLFYSIEESSCRQQYSIIWADQVISSCCLYYYSAPFSSNARINHANMAANREIVNCLKSSCSCNQVKIRDAVHQVNHLSIRTELYDGTMHYSNSSCLHTKVCCQAYDLLLF